MFKLDMWNKRKMSALLAAGLLAGCAGGPAAGGVPAEDRAEDRAERLLERTLAELEKETPPYRVNTEVTSGGVAVPGLRAQSASPAAGGSPFEWNLEESIRYLRQARKTVTLRTDPAAPDGQVLSVILSGTDWTELMKKDWQGRINAMQSSANSTIEERASRLTGDRAVRMRNELTASLQKARARMEQMVGSMEAGGEYTIKMRRGASRPDILVLENKLLYKANGTEKNETIRTIYDFRNKSDGP